MFIFFLFTTFVFALNLRKQINYNKMKKLLILAFCFFIGLSLNAQDSIFGTWKTIDDDTGKAKSIVEIIERDGKAYAIVKEVIFSENGTDPICEKCPGDRKGKKVVGMEIINGLSYNGSEWSGGTILDPKKGKEYTCEAWQESTNTLKVRGYWGFIYRTQTWHRVE